MPVAVRCYVMPGGTDPEVLKRNLGEAAPGAIIQTTAVGAASNEAFVEMIAEQTVRASASGDLLAKKPEIDLLLRLAGTTQIATAIESAGAKRGTGFLLLVVGEEKTVDALEGPNLRGAKRLARSVLTEEEMNRVEMAALLNALRA